MIDDLLSLRILLLMDSAPARGLLRRGAAAASIPVDFFEAANTVEACELVASKDIDVVFAGATLPPGDLAALAARAGTAARRPFVYVVAAAGAPLRADIGTIDGSIAMPTSADAACMLVDRCGLLHSPRRVLVVDDSLTMRGIVRKILAASRFSLDVADAEEANDALQQIDSGQIDLVLIDYNMPGLNGIEALVEIKRRHPQIHVVVMTSTSDAALAERARRAGAAGFLKKPFYPADINAVLHRVFGLDLSPP